jgi:hypothetical protein
MLNKLKNGNKNTDFTNPYSHFFLCVSVLFVAN